MSNPSADLIAAVMLDNLNFDAAGAALAAGADVNECQRSPLAPITAAATVDHPDMVRFLLGHGADPEKPVIGELPTPLPTSDSAEAVAILGERALHIAARGGFVEVVYVLLNEGRADPNATGNRGRTPLMAACGSKYVSVKIVRLLLEAGADPALAEEKGYIPLHAVAKNGRVHLVDMLYTAAPVTLNRCAALGETPLFVACAWGHEEMVSKLLSLGAIQPTPLDNSSSMCPLAKAAEKGFVGVVRVLINEGGIWAVGGEMVVARALYNVARFCRAKMLRLLLTGDDEEGRSERANSSLCGTPLLHFGVGFCFPAVVSILLKAGADEVVRDSEGRIPQEAIRMDLGQNGEPRMDRGEEIAIRRMLQRGPAYRARSWAWPSDEGADVGGSGDGDTAAAAAAAAAAVLSSPPAVKTPSVVGLRIFRPKEENNKQFFVRLVCRYCAKD